MLAGRLDRFLTSGAFRAAASLGIAESAYARIVATLRTGADATLAGPPAVASLFENLGDLTVMRVSFDRAARVMDEYVDRYPPGR